MAVLVVREWYNGSEGEYLAFFRFTPHDFQERLLQHPARTFQAYSSRRSLISFHLPSSREPS